MNYLIDIDGTLLNGSEPMAGAVDFIARLNRNSDKYVLMTNSIKSIDVQQKRLAQAGIVVESDRILNPIVAINSYLLERHIERAKIIGSELETNQIKARHVKEGYDIVILLDFEKMDFGYTVLQGILDDVENGTSVITASLSTYYLKNGRKAVDTGAFVKIIEDISAVHIPNFGKPSTPYFEIAGKLMQEEAGNICVIGDDWSTDILGANSYGAKSILVKTGKYKEKDELKCSPYRVVEKLLEL